ncbi:MAG: ThuA domain-containing protein [Thermoguttaceae bacterium]
MKSLVASCCLVAIGLGFGGAAGAEPAAEKIRVLLTYGGHDFEEKPFFAMFDALGDVQYAKAPLPESAGMLKPGLEKDYDVIVRYDMVEKFTPKQQEAFVALLHRGIGLVALHHNLGAHREWEEYARIIGGKYCFSVYEAGKKKFGPSTYEHDQDLKVTVADREHPITRSLADFAIHDEVYNHCYVAPGVDVLLSTNHPKNNPQIAWAHEYGKSRVFYFQLGHDSQAWKNTAYPEILARGIHWAAGK